MPNWLSQSLAMLLICVLLALSIFPRVMSHQGKSLELGVVLPRVNELIYDYQAKTGRLPESWGEIERELKPDLHYAYDFLCESHQMRHPHEGTLLGSRLRRTKTKSEFPELVEYEFSLRGFGLHLPIWVDTSEGGLNAVPKPDKAPSRHLRLWSFQWLT